MGVVNSRDYSYYQAPDSPHMKVLLKSEYGLRQKGEQSAVSVFVSQNAFVLRQYLVLLFYYYFLFAASNI